jgi:hypothetical protein
MRSHTPRPGVRRLSVELPDAARGRGTVVAAILARAAVIVLDLGDRVPDPPIDERLTEHRYPDGDDRAFEACLAEHDCALSGGKA